MKTISFRLVFLVLVLGALVLTSCGLRATQTAPSPTAPPASEETPEAKPADPLFAREAALAYLRVNYSETAPTEGLAWAETEVTTEEVVGSSSFLYSAGEWQVSVSYPIVAPEALVYQVKVSDTATGYHWMGTLNANGEVTEEYLDTDITPGWAVYSNEDYLFTFSYPETWTLEEVPAGEAPNNLYLTQGPYLLLIQFKDQSEDTVLGSGGRPPGEFESRGTVTFFEGETPKQVLVFEGLDKQVSYADETGELAFYIQLDDDSGRPYEEIALPETLQAEVDQILGTFARTGEPEPPPDAPAESLSYHNDAYQFSIQYPPSWELLDTPHAAILRREGSHELVIEFRRLYESISIGPTGTPAGEFIERGTVEILEGTYPRTVLVFEGADRAVYYNGTSTIDVGDVQFAISLNTVGDDPGVALPEPVQAEADQIVESLEVDFEIEPGCTDQVKFVSDVTVPDGAEFQPGEAFVKTWRLRNEGTCTWDTDYSLVFLIGEPMGYTEPIPLPAQVKPGETIDLSANLVAPESEGTHRGDWKLRNAGGEDFGAGEEADETFWVEINVGQVIGELELGAQDWQDTFNNSANWYLLDTPNTKFTVEDGQMVMNALKAGQGEEWGISTHGPLEDFYLEATFTTGSECSGLDRYGVLARAPKPDRGYVFGFSCDGRYRLYKWDGQNYVGLQEWASTAHIQPGPNQTNRLGFWAKGNTIQLYANGRLLVEIQDSTYDEGVFGLLVGSVNTDNLKVFVEDMAYWELD